MMIMAKKKEEKKIETFDIKKALNEVNPYLKNGFHKFILNKDIKSQKEFNELLEEYGGH